MPFVAFRCTPQHSLNTGFGSLTLFWTLFEGDIYTGSDILSYLDSPDLILFISFAAQKTPPCADFPVPFGYANGIHGGVALIAFYWVYARQLKNSWSGRLNRSHAALDLCQVSEDAHNPARSAMLLPPRGYRPAHLCSINPLRVRS